MRVKWYILIGCLSFLFLVGVIYGFLSIQKSTVASTMFGVSFSPEYARYLGLNSEEVYRTILDEWKFRQIRLAAQWDVVEKKSGQFDWQELDWLMDEANKRSAKIILAVGQKTPRWPECHAPTWASLLSPNNYQVALSEYITQVIKRYKNHPALEIWQIENEPFLPFGVSCPNFSSLLLSAEVALVKDIDPRHPTLVSDSGELSTWRKTARAADLFGTTMYRVVWNKYLGYWSYNWVPAAFYRIKLRLTGRSPDSAYIIELQGEPWIPNRHLAEVSLAEQYKSMNIEQLRKNIAYAFKVGMPRAYLWGAEWWFWLKEQNIREIPAFIHDLKKD